MSKLKWDQSGERLYETGVKNCVLYVMGSNGAYGTGVAWNGITAITENPSGAETTPLYADDIKYLDLQSAEEFGATVEAYMYPDAFMACDGSAELVSESGVYMGQQGRTSFALVYKTTIGDDLVGNNKGYKLHIIYGCKAAPSEKAYSTINDSPEAITFSWEITTTPVNVTGAKATSVITIDSTKADSDKLTLIEDALFGKDPSTEGAADGTEPTLLLPDQIKAKLTQNT